MEEKACTRSESQQARKKQQPTRGLLQVRINDLAAPPEPLHPLMLLGRLVVQRDLAWQGLSRRSGGVDSAGRIEPRLAGLRLGQTEVHIVRQVLTGVIQGQHWGLGAVEGHER